MSLKDVTDLVPCEVARVCFESAYNYAVRANLPPPGVPFFDAECGPWAGAGDVVEVLVSRFEVELRVALGLFEGVPDLAESEGVAV